MLTPKAHKSRVKYRARQQCRRAMDTLVSMRAEVDEMPDGPFKDMLLELIAQHEPDARPPRPRQERIRP